MSYTLKEMIEKGQLVEVPGVCDALSARVAETQGFDALYMTGYGTSAALFGYPDIGLVTMTEMVESAKRIADVVSIPIIADADTGYGNPVNTYRTVREFEKAGVSSIHIEDQEWPKRCGHMSGKKVIGKKDMVGKIQAALDARHSPDFLIIARTDALAVHGFEEAVERANLYAQAGADLTFIDAPISREQVELIPKLVPSKPAVMNLGPLTPNFSAKELKEMKYSVVIYPGVCLAAMVNSLMQELSLLKVNGKQKEYSEWKHSFAGLNEFLGMQKYRAMEEMYRSED